MNEGDFFKKTVESIDNLGTSSIESSRGHDLNIVMVDINHRTGDDGNKNTIILVYVRPDINPQTVYRPLVMTCQRLFGAKRDTRYFETSFIPKNSVQLSTGESGDFDCFDIVIKYPKSMLYDIDGLKSVFLTEFNRNLDKVGR